MISNKNYKKKDRIDTPRIFLRPMVESDAELIVSWINHLAKEQHSVFFNKLENLTIEQHLSWFKKRKNNRFDYIFFERVKEIPIGAVHFKNINKSTGVAEAGKIIGDFSFRKKGFAKEAFGFWLKYGFENLRLKKIYIFTDTNNISNINLNLKLGFQIIEEKKIFKNKVQEFLKMEISKHDISKINNVLNTDLSNKNF